MSEEKEALSNPVAPPPQAASIPPHDPPPYVENLGLSGLSIGNNPNSNSNIDTWRKNSNNPLATQPIALADSNSGSMIILNPFKSSTTTTTSTVNSNASTTSAIGPIGLGQPIPVNQGRSHQRSSSTSSISSLKSLKSKKSWFSFRGGGGSGSTSSTSTTTANHHHHHGSGGSGASSSSSRKVNEVRTTVCGLIRNLVVGPGQEGADVEELSPAALGILQSCAEVCSMHSLALSSILQEKFVESHSPLYWAIVKKPAKSSPIPTEPVCVQAEDQAKPNAPVNLLDDDLIEEPERHPVALADEDSNKDPNDLLGALLTHATPSTLTVDTITELRQACLATSDQTTFQRLRSLIPGFSSTSGADQVLLGANRPVDDVQVEIGSGSEGAFAATMEVPQFHKRMMISKEIGLEFVARNRLWKFSFMITPDNAWYGPPPGSWCVSLSLQEPSPPTWFDARILLPPTPITTNSPLTKFDTSNILRLKSKQMMEAPRNGVPATQIMVGLDENAVFGSLQYSGSSYVSPDEKLTVRLEAKLRKPMLDKDDCVVT